MKKKLYIVLPHFDEQSYTHGSQQYILGLSKLFQEEGYDIEIHTTNATSYRVKDKYIIWPGDTRSGSYIFRDMVIHRYKVVSSFINNMFIWISKCISLFEIIKLRTVIEYTDFDELYYFDGKDAQEFVKKKLVEIKEKSRYVQRAQLIKKGPYIEYDKIVQRAK
ncbi:MAG TPA: hypothetical protein PLS49_02420, partial [Candidatus Woesebacteria bacterium]|nr:hypothetical protein [Candidatus Woesebacteria bacterium]